MDVISQKYGKYHFVNAQDESRKRLQARTPPRPERGDAGRWPEAVRRGQEEKNAILKKPNDNQEAPWVVSCSSGGSTLDGPSLLRLHGVDRPCQLCSVDISEQNLSSVKPEDLRAFENVAYVDASVNSLPFGSFGSFVSLRELDLSLNGLRSVTFDPADFPHLRVLDLSFNTVSGDAIVSLGRLPRLQALRLTGNRLRRLPPDPGSSPEDGAAFASLQALALDDNRLSSGVFGSLANLGRLKHLNLQGNRISEIPYLWGTPNEERAEAEGAAAVPPRGLHREAETFSQMCATGRRRSPLPELQTLNLSGNKIAEEERLLGVAVFPKLREIDIRANPLTARRSEDPDLLRRLLAAAKRRDDRKLTGGAAAGKAGRRTARVSEEKLPEIRAGSKVKDDTQLFFITQAKYIPGHGSDPPSGDRDDEKKSSLCRMLMDPEADPEATAPVGIQTAVLLLERRLKNLSVYRDPKPKVDGAQTAAAACGGRRRRLDEMIGEIRAGASMSVASLSGAVSRRERKEALALLRDLEVRYRRACGKALHGDEAAA